MTNPSWDRMDGMMKLSLTQSSPLHDVNVSTSSGFIALMSPH